MGLKQKIKKVPALYNTLLSVLNGVNYFNRRFHSRFPSYVVTPAWRKRIDVVKADPDNAKLKRVPMSGKVFADHQLMHNGIKITLGSYYDYGNTHLLLENEGVHEPQEEYAFSVVLPAIAPGGIMMELGSYWAYYSLWFAKHVSGGRCFMVEPDPHKMNFGKLNFKLNGMNGTFVPGYISDRPNLNTSIRTYTVDLLMTHFGIDHLHILHSDIQGFELKMLEGCSHALSNEKIDYFFISTHSEALHRGCIDHLLSHRYRILCDANLNESFSVDGLIVARRDGAPGPDRIEISKRAS